jgi:hypothetical protein
MAKKSVNNFEISGKVLFVGLPIWKSATFSVRLLVLQVFAGKYRQEVPYNFVNERMGMLDNVRINDWVRLDFELRGKKSIQTDGKAQWWGSNNGLSATIQKEDDFAGLKDPT